MTTVAPSHFQSLGLPKFPVRSYCSRALTCQKATRIVGFCNTQRKLFTSFSGNITRNCVKPTFSIFCSPHKTGHARLSRLIYAAGSGLEASIADVEGNLITLKSAKIVVESQEDNKIQVRVDLTGDDTEKVFDKVLTNLARTAPPVPGFRRQKGGKTSKVPKSFLLDILGKERVTKFVIQEIISSTMGDYVKKENLNVKENKINTTQTAEELKLLFKPGTEFGFNAILELENSEIETPSITDLTSR